VDAVQKQYGDMQGQFQQVEFAADGMSAPVIRHCAVFPFSCGAPLTPTLALISERVGEQLATEPKEDLEALAEQELIKAAKIIEDAAKQVTNAPYLFALVMCLIDRILCSSQLSNVKAQPRPPQPTGKMDLSGPILDAAQAIADAAQHLIRAASEAQKERMARVRISSLSLPIASYRSQHFFTCAGNRTQQG
jgi:hypothetical protein